MKYEVGDYARVNLSAGRVYPWLRNGNNKIVRILSINELTKIYVCEFVYDLGQKSGCYADNDLVDLSDIELLMIGLEGDGNEKS